MSRGIFDKWRAAFKGTRGERELSAVAATGAPGGSVADLDVVSQPIDASLLFVSRELSGLTWLSVSAAAKERGWAALQREMERHPVKASAQGARGTKGVAAPAVKGAGAGSGARTVRPRNLKWALGSAVGVVAIVAAVLGSYSGGLLQTGGDGDGPGTVASVVTSDTTAPDTTAPDTTAPDTAPSVTTPTTVPATAGGVDSNDGVQPTVTAGPVVTEGPVTTGGTQSTAPAGTTPNTPATTSGSSGSGGSTGTGSTTTQPPRTTTTGQQQMAAAQRIGSAQAAVVYLADLVLTGNTSGARALVAPEAQSALAYMIASLTDPNGHKILGAQTLSDGTVRVSLQITDRVVNNAGDYVEKDRGFVIRVRVDGEDAVITAINAGS